MTPVKIYLLFLLLIPACAMAQLRGVYSTPHTGFGGTIIKFKRGHKFLFHAGGCLGVAIGEGHYLLKSDTLTLNFKVDTSNVYNTPNEIIATSADYERNEIEVSVYDNKTKNLFHLPILNYLIAKAISY